MTDGRMQKSALAEVLLGFNSVFYKGREISLRDDDSGLVDQVSGSFDPYRDLSTYIFSVHMNQDDEIETKCAAYHHLARQLKPEWSGNFHRS